MYEYHYQLDRSSKKFICPSCGKKRFVRYKDVVENCYLPMQYGRCDRQDRCGYHLNPYSDGYNKPDWNKSIPVDVSIKSKEVRLPSFIERRIALESMKKYDKNRLLTFLTSLLGAETTYMLAKKYEIGTSRHWEGATVFWQKDIRGRYRTGKVMLYDPLNGKRVKKPFPHINWVHSLLGIEGFNLRQCFFGEHLLESERDKAVALVESEKTAVIAAAYYPEFIWLATGGVNGCRWYQEEVSQVLKGRNIVLFPDLSASGKVFQEWKQKAELMKSFLPGSSIIVSDLLERRASSSMKEKGADLADFLIRYDVKQMRTDVAAHTEHLANPVEVCPIAAQTTQSPFKSLKIAKDLFSDTGAEVAYAPGVFKQRFSPYH